MRAARIAELGSNNAVPRLQDDAQKMGAHMTFIWEVEDTFWARNMAKVACMAPVEVLAALSCVRLSLPLPATTWLAVSPAR